MKVIIYYNIQYQLAFGFILISIVTFIRIHQQKLGQNKWRVPRISIIHVLKVLKAIHTRPHPHCSETKFNPNVPQLTSSPQIIKSYIYTCHFNKKSKYFTEFFTRYCPCTLGACVHAHLEKFLDFYFQLA